MAKRQQVAEIPISKAQIIEVKISSGAAKGTYRKQVKRKSKRA